MKSRNHAGAFGSNRRELLDYNSGLTGALRLGVVSSVGSSLLPLWAAAFHQAYPDIRFELFEANTYQLLEQLQLQPAGAGHCAYSFSC